MLGFWLTRCHPSVGPCTGSRLPSGASRPPPEGADASKVGARTGRGVTGAYGRRGRGVGRLGMAVGRSSSRPTCASFSLSDSCWDRTLASLGTCLRLLLLPDRRVSWLSVLSVPSSWYGNLAVTTEGDPGAQRPHAAALPLSLLLARLRASPRQVGAGAQLWSL